MAPVVITVLRLKGRRRRPDPASTWPVVLDGSQVTSHIRTRLITAQCQRVLVSGRRSRRPWTGHRAWLREGRL